MPKSGVVAAFLLAIHPWNIRYASEARGYSLLILLVPLLFVFWRRAMVSGQWKYWAAFALTEFSLVYCYPGSAFILVVLNPITVGLFVAGPECAEPRFAHAGRWFCVNVLAAMLACALTTERRGTGVVGHVLGDQARGLFGGLVHGSGIVPVRPV